MTDALGNPIVIGKRYGYSSNKNGFTYVRTGIATKQEGDKVTLHVDYSMRNVYSSPLTEDKLIRANITYKSFALFPVEENKVAN